MCLNYLDEHPKQLKAYKQRVGWKVFFREHAKGPLRFSIFMHNKSFIVPRKKWLKSARKTKSFVERPGDKAKYQPRFHIYLRKPFKQWGHANTLTYPIKKVRWRGPVAVGYQSGLPVVVATWLRVD